jgi:HEAT repeat protein
MGIDGNRSTSGDARADMGAARQIYGRYLRRETEFADLVRSLRSYYHSLNADEREEVVDILGGIAHPDATRELMQLYAECQWRTTRFQVIRALSKNPTPRSLEFLMGLAKDPSDVPLCEAALWALGQSRSPQAGRFLVHLYGKCAESVLPFVVGALARVPGHGLRPRLVSDLARAVDAGESLLTRYLVSSLGEMREPTALPLILPLLGRRENPALARTALLAVGKLARSLDCMRPFERWFQGDAFASDLFASVRSQVALRASLSAEDCVDRVLSSTDPLPMLSPVSLELNLFPADEVFEILSARDLDSGFRPACRLLACLGFPSMANWYALLFPFRSLTRERVFHVLESMQAHESADFAPLLEAIRAKSLRDIRSPLFERWFQAASLTLPDAETVFGPYLESPEWRDAPTDQKIIVINHFVNFALCVQADDAHFESVCSSLKKALLTEELPQVRARLLRAFGQLDRCDDEVFAFIRNRIHDVRLASSALFCVERARPSGGLDLCLEIVSEGTHKNQLTQGLLRCMAEQAGSVGPNLALDQFLKRCLARECPPETQLLALNLLARHPRRELLPQIVSFTRAEERLQIAAVVALRNHADDAAVDALAECLHAGSESVVGRALDSLTSAPGVRSKLVVLDYLESHLDDLQACDKIIRCLGPAGVAGVDLSGRVERLIRASPNHPMIDGFFLLKERLNPGSALSLVTRGLGADLEAIDERIAADLPCYLTYDEELRSVLRAAEMPFARPEIFGSAVDTSVCVVQFCKAIDMRIERTWGKGRLFPALEKTLHVFQNIVHGAGLGEETPSAERVLRTFDLAGAFTRDDLPLGKICALTRGILEGRVVGDHWKIFDGLRAWAVALALFGRSAPAIEGMLSASQRRVMPYCAMDGAAVLDVARALIRLQDARSLAVHRQTFASLGDLRGVRSDAMALLAAIQGLI